MARNYAALPHEYLEEMAALNDAEFGRLARALLEYSRTGCPIALGGNERFYAARVMMQEDRFQESYDDVSEKRRAAGKAGGRPKKQTEASESKQKQTEASESKQKQTEASESKQKQTKASESKKTYTKTKTKTNTDTLLSSDEESESIARTREDSPPALQDIRAYAKEIGSTVSPEQFHDYYAATSWIVRGQKLTDWRAMFRRWTRKEEADSGQPEPTAPKFGVCL